MNSLKLTLLLLLTATPAHSMVSVGANKLMSLGMRRISIYPLERYRAETAAFAHMPVDEELRTEMLQRCFGRDLFTDKDLKHLTKQTELISRDFILRFACDTRAAAKLTNKGVVTIAIAQSTLEKNKELYEEGIVGVERRKELLCRQLIETLIITGIEIKTISGWTDNDDIKEKNKKLNDCLKKLHNI
jgi:hypothetical protein